MKKSVKDFGVSAIDKNNTSKKKRKKGVLKDGAAHKVVLTDKTVEKKCLVEETSMNYKERSVFNEDNSNQILKGPRLVTKKALSTPLRKINFLDNVDNDNIFLDVSVVFSSLLKNLVNVSIRKSFDLNIGLNKVAGKFFHEKLAIFRKLFSKINSLEERGVSTLLKIFGIIRASFTFELSLVQTIKKARIADILVNTDLKKSVMCSNWAVIVKKILIETSTKAVYAALTKFGSVVLIKMQLVGLWQKTIVKFAQSNQTNLVTAKWFILIGKDAIRIVGGSLFPPFLVHNGLAAYGSSLEIKPVLMVFMKLNNKFVTLEHNLVSLAECIDKLAKRLDTSGPMVSQLSLECQPLVTSSLQNQEVDIIISKDSDVATGGGTNVEMVMFNSLAISKMEKTLNNLSVTVMSLSAKIENAGLVPTLYSSQ
ncbi:hypothetical protein G9A89_021286 [Geosiphon pyriformis]|nr:hypothetical protein G9A89_021286 [Geosiphon pyriformis]